MEEEDFICIFIYDKISQYKYILEVFKSNMNSYENFDFRSTLFSLKDYFVKLDKNCEHNIENRLLRSNLRAVMSSYR